MSTSRTVKAWWRTWVTLDAIAKPVLAPGVAQDWAQSPRSFYSDETHWSVPRTAVPVSSLRDR